MKDVNHDDSAQVLTQAISANPRKVELYYLAARIELSRASPSPPGNSSPREESAAEKAVEWLVKCVKKFYVHPPEEVSTKLVLVLYR